jgi:trehalose 6-phosphate synthase/phosphatase
VQDYEGLINCGRPGHGENVLTLRKVLSANPNWRAMAGSTIRDEIRDDVRFKALSEFSCCTVFLSEQDLENFYQGFCNETIWPLFHYFPTYARYDEAYWQQYRKVNESFSVTLLDAIRPDEPRIHDYH